MKNIDSDETLAIKEILCPICIEVYNGRRNDAEEDEKSKQPKDIYLLEQEAMEMEKDIKESIPSDKLDACWGLVIVVQDLAWRLVQKEVGNYAEQEMLYNILMAEALKAAKSYDPTKSKFSTWVFQPWRWKINEFHRVKRLSTQSLSAYSNNPDNQTTLQDQLKYTSSSSPEDYFITKELDAWGDSTLNTQPRNKFMIDDACQGYEWLCVFCRRNMRDQYFRKIDSNSEQMVGFNEQTAFNVYARRMIWMKI